MMEYYDVHIVMTAKGISSKEDRYQAFDEEVKKFSTTDEVKEWLKEQYGGHKKVRMYQDPGNEHVGWVYCFKNKDWSHNSKSWWQQDWITVHHIQSTPILIT